MDGTLNKVWKATTPIWLFINLISTALTIFAIFKILKTAKELEKYIDNVTINKRTMTLHAAILSLQSLVTIINSLLPYIPFLYNRQYIINIILVAVEVLVQLAICFICLTMGSHEFLRKFKLTLDLSNGAPKVVFSRMKESVIQSFAGSE
jgi:hypothetical protein